MTQKEPMGKKFEVGQRVEMFDKEHKIVNDEWVGATVYGEVLEVGDESILVQWDDLNELGPTEHEREDFDSINVI